MAVWAAQAVVPEHRVEAAAVRLTGVGPDNPILYDNDCWFDVFDNNYLWAQASLGNANLRGAAGEMPGKFFGNNWSDGDCYKWIEAAASVHAVNRDPELDRQRDEIIALTAQPRRRMAVSPHRFN